jgi:hypothetical protein
MTPTVARFCFARRFGVRGGEMMVGVLPCDTPSALPGISPTGGEIG